jgi:medium-chain acyl-[acyl-carrier-protein] hydrolase
LNLTHNFSVASNVISSRGSNSIWFENLSRGHAGALNLVCFPYAGASAQIFHHWPAHFSPELGIYLVHLPGRGKRLHENPFTRLAILVDAIMQNMPDELLESPFAFYGHSMGALLSFEIARAVRRRYGIEPVRLIVSGRSAPHVAQSKAATHNLPHDEFIARIRELNGTPPELLECPDFNELFLPLLRADFELVHTYQYRPEQCLSCPITVYGGLEDKEVPEAGLRAWKEHTATEFNLRLFPGDHFFINAADTHFIETLRFDVCRTSSHMASGLSCH